MRHVHIVASEDDAAQLGRQQPGARVHVLGGLLREISYPSLTRLDLNLPSADRYHVLPPSLRRGRAMSPEEHMTAHYLIFEVLNGESAKIPGLPRAEVVAPQLRQVTTRVEAYRAEPQ